MTQLVKRYTLRLILYGVIFSAAFALLRLLLGHLDLLHTSVENARYLLSAMAQSQAAIVAIVVTVSLVAVQLGASSYSPRVVSIFKSNPDLWFLLLIYGGSVLYDLFILKILSQDTGELLILISYCLCVVAFFALFPYIRSAINILSPQAILQRLLEDVHLPERRIRRSQEMDRIQRGERDPFQPVVDIIRGAFVKYDYETARMGLELLTSRAARVLESFDVDKYRFVPGVRNPLNPFDDFSEYYCDHLGHIGRLFAERDEELTQEVIKDLRSVAGIMTERRLGREGYVVQALGRIGQACVQRGLREATDRTMDAIGAIGQ